VNELSDTNINALKIAIPKLVGNRIQFLRKTKGITQTELGKLTGKDRQYIYKIEKGIVTSNIVTIAIICNALDISLKYFFDF
jgi:transcriptional regulator with XRE-family HTH domain